MLISKILTAHGIRTKNISGCILADNENGTWTKFKAETDPAEVYKYLGY